MLVKLNKRVATIDGVAGPGEAELSDEVAEGLIKVGAAKKIKAKVSQKIAMPKPTRENAAKPRTEERKNEI